MSNLIKEEKECGELLDELLEENKKTEDMNKEIEEHKIIERIYIKEIESEILYETKSLEENKQT